MNEVTVSYGGFWKRVVAYIIDAVIILIPVTTLFGTGMPDDITSGQVSIFPQIMMMLAGGAYFVGLESSIWQATVGKKLLGMQITDTSGQRITPVKAVIRYFSKILSSLIFMIGFIMIAFTGKKQGLHDLISGTYVVDNG